MYSVREAISMAWGKLRRAFLIAFRKDRVVEKLSRRRGACSRCGACCKILFNCPAYDDSDGSPKCLIYNDRPGVCGLFPLDEKDLRERNVVMPEKACGFWFEDGPRPEHLPPVTNLRWGPPKTGVGTIAILKTMLRKPTPASAPNGNGNGNGNGKH